VIQVKAYQERRGTSVSGKLQSSTSPTDSVHTPDEGCGKNNHYLPLKSSDTDDYTKAFELAQKTSLQGTSKHSNSLENCGNVEAIEVVIEDQTNNGASLDPKGNCDNVCDISGDTGSLLLLSRHSDDTLDMECREDSEIFCDSDSRSMYKLEADV